MHQAQRFINHVDLVLDASASMTPHKQKLIEAADQQIRDLALQSEELKQQTHVSVYTFNSTVQCLIFDLDVMRLPSIADLYSVGGRTALVDAVIKSQEDLMTTSQLYGDHAFLTFVLTDGEENQSKNGAFTMGKLLTGQPDNWNVAFLVPDQMGVTYLKRLGINGGNIAIWDTTSTQGLEAAATTIKTATSAFMTSRGTKRDWAAGGVFSTGTDTINHQTVRRNLSPMKSGYQILPVPSKVRIDDWVNRCGIPYRVGRGYYELSKTEHIQPQKDIIVVDRKTKTAYSGPQARDLLGLPHDVTVTVKPTDNPLYKIFVQSTSVNRNLMPDTEVLVLT